MSDDDSEAFESDLRTAFGEQTTDDAADDAAAKAAAFREEYELDLSADAFLDAVDDADYGSFQHRFDYVIGDLAAAEDDCTDSREYRLAGFGDLAADPEQGA